MTRGASDLLLYHFTCDHARSQIGARGVLRPMSHPLRPGISVVWLTDLAFPHRAACGLGIPEPECDRMSARYLVIDGIVEPWEGSAYRAAWTAEALAILEDPIQGRRPDRWWISVGPVNVRLA